MKHVFHLQAYFYLALAGAAVYRGMEPMVCLMPLLLYLVSEIGFVLARIEGKLTQKEVIVKEVVTLTYEPPHVDRVIPL